MDQQCEAAEQMLLGPFEIHCWQLCDAAPVTLYV